MRVAVRVISALLGLAVVAAGILLVVGVVSTLLRVGGEMPSAAVLVPWDDARVRGAGVVLVVAGLLLLLLGLASGRRDVLLRDPAPEVTIATDRRSLARLVGRRVRAAEGVAAASVTATGARIRVKATGDLENLPELSDRLSETAQAAVRELPLHQQPAVSVSVSQAKER